MSKQYPYWLWVWKSNGDPAFNGHRFETKEKALGGASPRQKATMRLVKRVSQSARLRKTIDQLEDTISLLNSEDATRPHLQTFLDEVTKERDEAREGRESWQRQAYWHSDVIDKLHILANRLVPDAEWVIERKVAWIVEECERGAVSLRAALKERDETYRQNADLIDDVVTLKNSSVIKERDALREECTRAHEGNRALTIQMNEWIKRAEVAEKDRDAWQENAEHIKLNLKPENEAEEKKLRLAGERAAYTLGFHNGKASAEEEAVSRATKSYKEGWRDGSADEARRLRNHAAELVDALGFELKKEDYE